MDYTKQIFEMLGVEPGEEFQLKFIGGVKFISGKDSYQTKDKYKFDESLRLFWFSDNIGEWRRHIDAVFLEILDGTAQIVKIPRPTVKEQLAIDYARACGYKWVAKDENKKVFAFKNKPIKAEPQSKYNISRIGIWHDKGDEVGCMRIEIPISFLHWEDEEPYYIGVEQ